MTKSVYIFVDDSNLVGICRNRNKNLDWIGLRDYLLTHSQADTLLEMVVYVGLPPLTDALRDRRDGKEKYIHWLRSQGFLVFTHSGSPVKDDPANYAANVDILMALSCFELCTRNRPDIAMVVTNDGDFAPLPIFLRNYGIKVEIAAVESIIGSNLKDCANTVIDLDPFFHGLADLR